MKGNEGDESAVQTTETGDALSAIEYVWVPDHVWANQRGAYVPRSALALAGDNAPEREAETQT